MKIHRPFYSACVAAVLVALPLAVSGCSDDDATTTDDPIPSLGTADGELFRAEITSELCRIEASCNLGMLPDDAERCAAFVARSPLAPPSALSLDPEQSTSCLTALANLSCTDALTFMTEDEGFRDICLTAVVGDQPEGATCASDYDCQAGLECAASPIDGPCATCVVEDACDGRCATGQHCSDGECVEGCVDDGDCAVSDYCVPETGSCAARSAEGAPCDAQVSGSVGARPHRPSIWRSHAAPTPATSRCRAVASQSLDSWRHGTSVTTTHIRRLSRWCMVWSTVSLGCPAPPIVPPPTGSRRRRPQAVPRNRRQSDEFGQDQVLMIGQGPRQKTTFVILAVSACICIWPDCSPGQVGVRAVRYTDGFQLRCDDYQ